MGVLSKAKSSLTESEFQKMQKILQNHNKNNYILAVWFDSLTNLQFHMIACIDDTTQVLIDNIQVQDADELVKICNGGT